MAADRPQLLRPPGARPGPNGLASGNADDRAVFSKSHDRACAGGGGGGRDRLPFAHCFHIPADLEAGEPLHVARQVFLGLDAPGFALKTSRVPLGGAETAFCEA
jgi:hypothetical protein